MCDFQIKNCFTFNPQSTGPVRLLLLLTRPLGIYIDYFGDICSRQCIIISIVIFLNMFLFILLNTGVVHKNVSNV